MCVILYKPRHAEVNYDDLEKCFKRNDDGAGFVYAHEGKLYTEKGFFHFSELEERVKLIPKGAPALIHCRIGTSGANDKRNCHPFKVRSDLSLVHNGVMTRYVHKDFDGSDTMFFTKKVLGPIARRTNGFLIGRAGRSLIEELTGTGNKIALINKDGKVMRSYPDAWTRVGQLFYSNTHWQPYTTTKTRATTYGSGYGYGYSYGTGPKERFALTYYAYSNITKSHTIYKTTEDVEKFFENKENHNQVYNGRCGNTYGYYFCKNEDIFFVRRGSINMMPVAWKKTNSQTKFTCDTCMRKRLKVTDGAAINKQAHTVGYSVGKVLDISNTSECELCGTGLTNWIMYHRNAPKWKQHFFELADLFWIKDKGVIDDVLMGKEDIWDALSEQWMEEGKDGKQKTLALATA